MTSSKRVWRRRVGRVTVYQRGGRFWIYYRDYKPVRRPVVILRLQLKHAAGAVLKVQRFRRFEYVVFFLLVFFPPGAHLSSSTGSSSRYT